jgi:hypothetical protein
LQGIDDYIKAHSSPEYIIHVESSKEVSLISKPFGPFSQRETFVKSFFSGAVFPFACYMPIEDFIIELQSKFVPDETIKKLLEIVSNIQFKASEQFTDSGHTQSVTAKAGIAKIETVDLPNPVTLRPFRTFSEVEQPASSFVFRMKFEGKPQAGLWTAGGTAWELEAIANIHSWLIGVTKGQIPIIA